MMQKCNGSSGRGRGTLSEEDVPLQTKSYKKTNVGITKVGVTMAAGLFCPRQLGAEQREGEEDRKRHDDHQPERGPDGEGRR